MSSVSIITALHNKGAYISETIESVISQTMRDWEMIVVENYSTDDGPEIALGFSQRDARVRFVEAPPEVRGPGAARNCGLEHATGDWILFLDADDLIAPDYLEKRLASATEVPHAPLVVGGWTGFYHGENGAKTPREPVAFRRDAEAVRDAAIGFAPWILHAALVKKSWMDANRHWPEELDSLPSEDAAFWFRVVLNLDAIAWCDNRGAFHRLGLAESREGRTDSLRRAEALRGVIMHNLACLAEKGLEPTEAQCETLARVYEESARSLRQAGAKTEARAAMVESSNWLAKTRNTSASIRLRKIFGPAAFHALRECRDSLRRLVGPKGDSR